MGLWGYKVKEVAIVELNISDFYCFPLTFPTFPFLP